MSKKPKVLMDPVVISRLLVMVVLLAGLTTCAVQRYVATHPTTDMESLSGGDIAHSLN